MDRRLRLLVQKKNNALCAAYHEKRIPYLAAVSGFGEIAYSCDFFVERITEERRLGRHYRALVRLADRGLAMLGEEQRRLLVARYVDHTPANELYGKLGMSRRTYFRRQAEASGAFSDAIGHLLTVYVKTSTSRRVPLFSSASDERKSE